MGLAREERPNRRGANVELKASGLSLLLVSAITCGIALCLSVGGAVEAQAAVRYVDGSLSAPCSTYSVQSRSCSGMDGNAYPTIQQAVTAVNPGDVVYVRGGIYNLASRQEILLATLCTRGAPCVLSGYQNEVVTIRGPVGYPAADANNGRGQAIGPVDPSDRAKLLHVTGNYWTITKLILENGGWYGCEVGGSNNLLTELVVRHNWATGCQVVTGGHNNTFRYVAAHHTRHGSGLEVTVASDETGTATGNRFERNLAYKNGRDGADVKVLNYPGPGGEGSDPGSDPGGGNSDGMGTDKGCADAGALPKSTNACQGTVFLENLIWKNTDDCLDMSASNSWVIGNFVSDCGPEGNRGFKLFFQAPGVVYSGNLCYLSQDTCFDPQALDPITYINNAAISTPGYGFRVSPLNALRTSVAANNISFNNGLDYDWASIPTVVGNLNTDPGLVNRAVALAYSAVENDAGFPATTIQSRWQSLWNQIEGAFKPASGTSAVVNAGTVVPGYHCPLADDKGQDVKAACRHWMGSAPDIGPFEFGITGNPDRRFSTTGGSPTTGPPAAPAGLTVK